MAEKQKTMTVDEVYDFIVKQMTPETALKKFLEGALIKYQHLKFNEGEEVHPLFLVAMAAFDMGWNMMIEDENVSEDVRGITIGNDDYLKSIGVKIPENE